MTESEDRVVSKKARILGVLVLLYGAGLHLAAMDVSGWSYLAAPIALLGSLLYKPLRQAFPGWHEGCASMRISDFCMLLLLTLSTQFVAQLAGYFLPDRAAAGGYGLPALLYVCLFAPVGEELLFRGFTLSLLKPHGKKLALFASALLFALLHGNWVQLPYTFLLGVVLGYAALRFGVIWSAILHIANNLLMGYGFPALLSLLPATMRAWVICGLLLTLAVIGAAILAANCVKIFHWLRQDRTRPAVAKAFFGAWSVGIFMMAMLLLLLRNQ